MSLSYDDYADLPKKPPVGGGILVDGQLVAETRKCVHCSAAWYPRPGSGTKRGYCYSCKGLVCGSPNCMNRCIPLEARLQGWENGDGVNEVLRTLDSMPKTIL